MNHGILINGKRFFGYHADKPAKRAARPHLSQLLAHFGAQPIPDAASLAQFRAPIFDQGRTGSCGGHGTAQLTSTAMAAAGTPLPYVTSPWFFYGNGRIEDLPGPDVPLSDGGLNPSTLITALRLYGTRDRALTRGLVTDERGALVTPDGRFSDVWGPEDGPAPPNVNTKPDFAAVEDGRQCLVVGEYNVLSGQEDLAGAGDLMASCIGIARRPVGIGWFVDTSVMEWTADKGPLDRIDYNDPNGGGHWTSCDAYTTESVGGVTQRVFEIPNSWGTGYGDRGVVRVTESALLSVLLDAIAWTVRSP